MNSIEILIKYDHRRAVGNMNLLAREKFNAKSFSLAPQ